MSAHTPGPWVMRPAVCRQDHPETSADVNGPDGQFVADCGCHDQAKSNAEFIVRACNAHDDLLLVLHEARGLVAALAAQIICPHDNIWRGLLDRIDAAIAKAEGCP